MPVVFFIFYFVGSCNNLHLILFHFVDIYFLTGFIDNSLGLALVRNEHPLAYQTPEPTRRAPLWWQRARTAACPAADTWAKQTVRNPEKKTKNNCS